MSDDTKSASGKPSAAVSPLSPISVGLLMALGTMGQLSINIILPSLPAIGSELQVALGAERLVLSVFLFGFAGGQLIVGPLSDRFGRRQILIPGLVIYAVFGAIAAISAALDWLLIARLLQGLGAASGFVIARAIARDAFQGAALIRIFGLLTLTMGIVPALAPALGGVIQDSVGWQANMGVTVIMGVIMTVLCFIFLPETGTKSEGSFSPPQIALTYISIIKDRTFRRFAGTNALVLGSLYAFHAGAPELMISQLGLNPSTFGLLAFLHSVAFMLGAYTAPMIGERIPEPSHVMGGGAVTALIASVAMLALGLTDHATVVSIMIFMTIFGYALGVVIPYGVAGALSPFKARAGTATALLGAMQMSAGALASATVAAFPDVPALAFPAVMVAMNALAIINARRSRHEIAYKEEP